MMTKILPIDMRDALRLTRQGRLGEAVSQLFGGLTGMHKPAPGDEKMPEAEVLRRVFAPLAFAPARPKIFAPEVPGQAQGAQFEERVFANAAGQRNYKLFIPSNSEGKALPLVVMLHGCTQSPDDFAAGTQMNALAEEQKFLVAYPAQPRTANMSKCWNWFKPGDQTRGQGEPSLIAGITQQVMHDFSVPSGQVYIAGLSAGGAAAAIMGSAYPELYAAIGVHSGLACGAASDVKSAMEAMRQGAAKAGDNCAGRVIPTIVFHGDQDKTVNVVNGDQVIAQAKGNAKLRTTVTEGESPGGIRYTHSVQSNDTGRPLLEEWVLHGAGHAWSGGNPAGTFTDPRGPDASREMVRFFRRQRV
jgi:poly(hydroxyalkanoate) depolymerase family esterase